jgi:hypothetical protein
MIEDGKGMVGQRRPCHQEREQHQAARVRDSFDDSHKWFIPQDQLLMSCYSGPRFVLRQPEELRYALQFITNEARPGAPSIPWVSASRRTV